MTGVDTASRSINVKSLLSKYAIVWVTLLVFIWCMLNLSNVSSFLYKDF
mgnify:CR=1 FL=1